MDKETRKLFKESCENVIKCNGLCEYNRDDDKCKDWICHWICQNDPNKEPKEKVEIVRNYLSKNYNNLWVGLEIDPVGDCFVCPSRFKVDHNNLCRAFGEWIHQGDVLEPCEKCIEQRKEM